MATMESSSIPPYGITVWVVEDSTDFRETIQEMLNQSEGIRCPRVFSSAEEILAALQVDFAPEVILMDIRLPAMDGVECVRRIRSRSLNTQIIMLTVHTDTNTIFEAICAGASGYMLKGGRNDAIVEAIRDVTRGNAPINGQIARRVLDIFTQRFKKSWDYQLTERETEILRLLVEGLTKSQIAETLFISTNTVDFHTRGIYQKLEVNSAREAVVKAIKEGVVRF